MQIMYDPSAVGKKGTIFGLPYSQKESDLLFIQVPLDVTASYRAGTSKAPSMILEESAQLDLSLPGVAEPWLLKMAIMEKQFEALQEHDQYRSRASKLMRDMELGEEKIDHLEIEDINLFCEAVHKAVYDRSIDLLNEEKHVAIMGGDHSSSLGLMQALGEKNPYGILQIDAHMDLRDAYEGFQYSHASIMNNALKVPAVQSLTQVAIRDYCKEEEDYIKASSKPIHVFLDEEIYCRSQEGHAWSEQVQEIIQTLPSLVYVSLDVDGLDPSLCPNTGTPVPGGLSFNQICLLFSDLVKSGRKIIGFDICESGASTWDANVSARLLYRLSVFMGISNDLLAFRS